MDYSLITPPLRLLSTYIEHKAGPAFSY